MAPERYGWSSRGGSSGICDAWMHKPNVEFCKRWNGFSATPYEGEKVLAQETGRWRFRAGEWRIRYDIAGNGSTCCG